MHSVCFQHDLRGYQKHCKAGKVYLIKFQAMAVLFHRFNFTNDVNLNSTLPLACKTGGLAGRKAKCDAPDGIISFVSRLELVVALRARVSRFALCPANPPVLQAILPWAWLYKVHMGSGGG